MAVLSPYKILQLKIEFFFQIQSIQKVILTTKVNFLNLSWNIDPSSCQA